MCGSDHEPIARGLDRLPDEDRPPDWRSIDLPDRAILRRLTDAHCHPTDTPFEDVDASEVALGGLCAMATRMSDQSLVGQLGEKYGVRYETEGGSRKRLKVRDCMEVTTCFGYHPWFSHLLSLAPPSETPTKREHYRELFLPTPSSKQFAYQEQVLESSLSDLPDPIPFAPLLQVLRQDILAAQERGNLVMLGEVGLDKSFRVPYPQRSGENVETAIQADHNVSSSGAEEVASHVQQQLPKNVLTPFRPSMEHQVKLLEMQMEVATQLGVNVSLHSVQCQGPTLDFLRDFSQRHPSFYSINFDIHSCGGFSLASYSAAQKRYPNMYLSPSLAISARSPGTPDLIRSVRQDRLLVESDTHLIGDTTRRVWAATVWIARCRGWKVGGISTDGNDQEDSLDVVDVLERNWKTFMKIV